MLKRKLFLKICHKWRLYYLGFWHIQLLSRWFYHFFVSFLKYFPNFDRSWIICYHFFVPVLSLQPVDALDCLLNLHALQIIKLSIVRLKLSIIVILITIFLISLWCLKNYYSSCLISNGKILSSIIKLYSCYNVLVLNFLICPFVSKYLGEFVIRSFTHNISSKVLVI